MNKKSLPNLLSIYIKNHLSFFYIPIIFSFVFVLLQLYFFGYIDQKRIIVSMFLFLLSSYFFVRQQRLYKKFITDEKTHLLKSSLFKIMINKACYVLPWLFIIFWPYKTEYLFDLSLGFLIVFLAIGFYTAISSSNLILLFFDISLQVIFCGVILILNWDNIETNYILLAVFIFTTYSLWIGIKLNTTTKSLLDSNKNLQIKTEEANKASRAKSNFLAMISHEIRTPLHGINSTIESLHDTRLDQGQKNNLNIISRCSHTLLSMLNDVLDLSKIEAKKINIEIVEFNFHELIADIIEINSATAKKKEINLKYEIEKNVPKHIISDPTRINQIIFNLISNAIKFTQKGLVHLRVSYDKSENIIIIEVQDTGIGIDEENIDRIFSNFEQEHSGTTRTFGGSGLGLPIVKELLALLNGNVHVQSQKGKGSTFSVDIPISIPSKIETIQNQNLLRDVKINLSNCRILVAEDNKINRMNIDQSLQKYSCVADLVNDGLEAVHYAHKHHYDIIFMDVNMPNLNGIEAAHKIKETKNKNTPVIALSAITHEETIRELYSAGIVEHIIKPFDRDTLIDVIDLYKPTDSIKIKNKLDQIYEDFEETFCIKFIDDSFKEIERLYTALKNAASEGNIESVSLISHEVCGVSGTIGMYQTHAQSKDIELLSLDKTELFILSSKIDSLVHTIDKEFNEIKKNIQYFQ